MKPPLSIQKRSGDAFTLAEVAFAIGLLGFCLVSIMALLPTGLASYRDSIETTHHTRITQSIRSQLQALPYTELPKTLAITYDESAGRTEDTGAPARYAVEAALVQPTSLPGGGSLQSMARVEITITNLVTRSTTKDHLHLSDNGL